MTTLLTGCHSSGSAQRSSSNATSSHVTSPTGTSPTATGPTAGNAGLTAAALRQKMVSTARAVVTQTGLEPTRAFLLFQSCNDDGSAPFRATVSSGFAGSTIDLADSERQVAGWVSTLVRDGWAPSGTKTGTNGRYLSRDALTVALFPHREPQASPSPTFTITSGCLLGDEARSDPEFRTGVNVLSQV